MVSAWVNCMSNETTEPHEKFLCLANQTNVVFPGKAEEFQKCLEFTWVDSNWNNENWLLAF